MRTLHSCKRKKILDKDLFKTHQTSRKLPKMERENVIGISYAK